MANVYGTVRGNRGEASRCGKETVVSRLETWQGAIETILHKDGNFSVRVGPKNGTGETVCVGNVNDRSGEIVR